MRYAPKIGVGLVKVASGAAYVKEDEMMPGIFAHDGAVMGHPVLTLRSCRGEGVCSQGLPLESSWAVR
jgi:hypothetical protein